MTAGIIIIAIIAVCGLWFVSTQRSLVQLDENCKNNENILTLTSVGFLYIYLYTVW